MTLAPEPAAPGGLVAHVVVDRGGWRLEAALAAAAGETLVLLGPNAAGKTTALRALAGLVPLTGGRIALAGRVLDEPAARTWVPPERRDVGVVFQDYLLFPHLSALDNVAFGLRERGHARREARAAAVDWLGRVGLDDVAALRPDRLSGGQAQRVALARALATGPGLLLLDEPLAALDAGVRGSLRADLRRHLRDFRGPSLVVTHDQVDAMVLADRLVVVEDGRITQAGSPEQVARRPSTPYVADLMGLNLLRGQAAAGEVRLDGGGRWWLADRTVSGPVCVSLRPEAVSLHLTRPQGSPRNVWGGVVAEVEPRGDLVRVSVDARPAVAVSVTAAAVADLGLAPGTAVWCSAKATDVEAYPA